MDEEISGRNAAAVRRSKMTGKGRETREEKEKKEREAKKQQELQEKYEKWNKGIQQIREVSRPFFCCDSFRRFILFILNTRKS